MAGPSVLDIGAAMSEAMGRSRCNQVPSRMGNGRSVPTTARFKDYVQRTLDELRGSIKSSVRGALVQDILDIHEIVEMIAQYNSAPGDGFVDSVQPILTLAEKLSRDARQHTAIAPRLDGRSDFTRTEPRSDEATASRTASGMLRESPLTLGSSVGLAVAGMGDWAGQDSTTFGGYPETIGDFSDTSSDSEGSSCLSHGTTATSIGDGSNSQKGTEHSTK